ADAFRPKEPSREKHHGRSVGSGRRVEPVEIDSHAADENRPLLAHARANERLAILWILEDRPRTPAAERAPESEAEKRSAHPRVGSLGDEDMAQAGDGVDDEGDSGERRGDSTKYDRLERHVMDEQRPLSPIEARELDDRADLAPKPGARSSHADRNDAHARSLDATRRSARARRDRDIETSRHRRARERQPVAHEVPVLGDDIEKPRAQGGSARPLHSS